VADGPAAPKTYEQLKGEHRPPPPGVVLHGAEEHEEQSPFRHYVRDLILGFNDGLVSVFAIVAGVVGAGFQAHAVLLAGMAASVAGALSMGIGEYLSTKSQAEYYEAERRLEREHIAKYPELERRELAEYLGAKGIEGPMLEQLLDKLTADPERFLDVMMREEFGTSPEMQRSALLASGVIMLAFVVGAALPVLPFAFAAARPGMVISAGLSVGGLLAAGVVKARVSGLRVARSALEMAALGLAAALVTYGVGQLIGVAV
jgi:VIT1/CCC1 family predicted Fe2+/Mn2+ transporter